MESKKHYNCCIIGTGAAGGILAYRLAKSGLNVISLEQGSDIPESYFSDLAPIAKKHYFGIQKKMVFPPEAKDALFIHDLFSHKNTRSSSIEAEKIFKHFQIIALNGLQNLWNGVSVRFAPDDFNHWPISYADLATHYDEIEQKITVCGTHENLACIPDGIYVPPKPLRRADKIIVKAIQALNLPNTHVIPNRKAIETRIENAHHCISCGLCTFGCPTGAMYKFSTRLLPEIKNLPHYTLQLNSKVIRFIRDNASNFIKVAEVLDTQSHHKSYISSDYFILAAGAIESPRILFNSKDEVYPFGLANTTQTLGCYLQDNPKVVLSTALLPLWFSKQREDIGYGDLLLILSQAQLNNKQNFNFIGHSIHTIPDIPYYLSLFKKFPYGIKSKLVRTLYNSFVTLGLFCSGDFIKENRVFPSHITDQYGIAQVNIQFKSTPSSEEKMDKMLAFGKRTLRHAYGTIITTDRDYSGTGIHYAGTCRMHNDRSLGIIDKQLCSYDHPNLFICDGGVIPYLPEKHLTLTIMALANRLSTHLIELYKTHHARNQT